MLAGGQIVAASELGKLETVAQNIAVGALLFHYETLGLDESNTLRANRNNCLA
jgi:hypothetical protein